MTEIGFVHANAVGLLLCDELKDDVSVKTSVGKKLLLSPSVADPPLGPATDHHLGKLLSWI